MNISGKARAFALVLAALAPWSGWGGIVGGKHDFSGKGWNAGGEVCVVCHTPHNAKDAGGNAPLWNRDDTAAVFTLYNSATIKSTPGQPDGASRLCLGCHDGTIALDRFGGAAGGAEFAGGSARLGADLSNDHPVSFTYDGALAASKKTLKDPSSSSGLGGTIAADLLRSGKMQCVSCHDPHDAANEGKLLVKSNRGSALCLTCHNL